jgi:hypothetical protein
MPPLLHAQDATVVGQVVDASKAILPGATVTATSIATGREFVDVSGADGSYRLVGLPPNVYTIKAELTGFATVVYEKVELLVGQNASIGFVLQLAALEETVNVTGQSPLIDVRSAQVGGNVDRRQMEALPIVGRNWMGMSLMVKGVTGNDTSGNTAGGVRRESQYQLNLDGQQIKQNFAGASSFSQPVISREAIAEYQVVTNLFDVTMGRSAGLQVQAISRSGSNELHGSAFGFFRDDALNAADFVANRVLPYSNQQIGGSFGGPLKVNKLHFFTAYEYEREPTTTVVQPPRYTSSMTVAGGSRTHSALVRTDAQMGTAGNLTVRATYAKPAVPSGELQGTQYPSFLATLDRKSFFLTANHTKVFASNLFQEIRAGYFKHFSARRAAPGVAETPTYAFPGLTIGTRSNYPQEFVERVFTARYDLNWTKARHDMKIGGEWLGVLDEACWPSRVRGQYDYSAIPADIERRFPLDAWNDPSRWDFSGLESILLRYRVAYAELGGGYKNCGNFGVYLPRPTYAVWFADTWRVTDSLTVNLGLRYDLAWGDLRTPYVPETNLVINNGLFTENVGYRPDRVDPNNIAPRVGFSYDVSGQGRLVFRGGTGLFYTDNTGIFQLFQQLNNGFRAIQSEYRNDGLPGFFEDPTRGVTPEMVLSGQVPLPPQAINVMNTNLVMPYTWQSTVGFQKQLTDVMAFDADLIYWRTYDEDQVRDPNLFYNPATGFNLNPTTAGRPAPQNGTIELYESEGRSNYLALSTSLTRRFANNFQAYATYTVMFFKNDLGQGLYGNFGAYPNNPFDREAEWARSADFQRHTVRANGIWSLPWNFSVAGTFGLGSGNYFQPTSPVNPYGATGTIRVLADGTVLERNSFKGVALHKLDLRLSKSFTIAGVTLEGTAEVFNVYNHANYGSYNMVYGVTTFGQPVQNLGTAYLPRVWQLGARLSF